MQGIWPNGGGGGGRIALYYNTSTFTGTAESKGAAGQGGYNGEDGTVVFVDTTQNTLYPGHFVPVPGE